MYRRKAIFEYLLLLLFEMAVSSCVSLVASHLLPLWNLSVRGLLLPSSHSTSVLEGSLSETTNGDESPKFIYFILAITFYVYFFFTIYIYR